MIVQPVRVGETTTTTGTGTYTLAGAIDTGYATFLARLGAGTSRVHYACYSTAGYEVGIGEFNGSNQLSRSEIIYSSNSDNAVIWSAGTKTIIALWPGGVGSATFTAALTAAEVLVQCDALLSFIGSSNVTVALPAVAATPNGFSLTIRNASASNTVTIDPDGAETIDGAASWVVYPSQNVTIVRFSSNWLAFAAPRRKQIPAAWVSFSSTGSTPSVRDSVGMTSVTRGGAGSYSVTFTTARPSSNYAVVVSVQNVGGTGNVIAGFSGATTSGFNVIVTEANGTTGIDPGIVNVAVFDAAGA